MLYIQSIPPFQSVVPLERIHIPLLLAGLAVIFLLVTIIMAGKKRKLTKDLREVTAMATATCLNTSKKIADACQVLKNTCLKKMVKARSTDLSTEDAGIYLIARYGLKYISKICSVMSRLPDTLPAVYKARYTNECTNRQDADVIATFVESR